LAVKGLRSERTRVKLGESMPRALFVLFLAMTTLGACGRSSKQAPPSGTPDAAPPAPPAPAPADAAPVRPTPPPGPYHVLGPLRDTAAFDACATDEECIAAPLSCCPCSASGLAVAIRADKHAEWRAGTCQEEVACAQVISEDPTCRAIARCVSGRCRLTITPPEDPKDVTRDASP
jgi:hypothetical protein